MKLPFYIVDVFTEKKYSGNQLAVFFDADKLSTEQMQQITREINFAESTFVTQYQPENNSASIRIFTPAQEMQFAGHPIIGTSWVLMNKMVEKPIDLFTLTVPIGTIPIQQKDDLVWLQAAQPKFFEIFSKSDFLSFSNLQRSDFDDQFAVQEVSTGSAFVIVPLNNKKALANLRFDLNELNDWLQWHCKTNHRALYLYCFEDEKLYSRMFCIENNQLIEDAATGSASSCLQAYLLKYQSPEIVLINHQGEFVNRPSAIYFDGKKEKESFEIKIGGQTQFIAKGEWEV